VPRKPTCSGHGSFVLDRIPPPPSFLPENAVRWADEPSGFTFTWVFHLLIKYTSLPLPNDARYGFLSFFLGRCVGPCLFSWFRFGGCRNSTLGGASSLAAFFFVFCWSFSPGGMRKNIAFQRFGFLVPNIIAFPLPMIVGLWGDCAMIFYAPDSLRSST